METSRIPLRMAQVSDIHCGTPTFDTVLMRSVIDRVNRLEPDVVLVVGDLTAEGHAWEFEEAAQWIERFEAPAIVVPGNHDSRNLGYLHFQRLFGERFLRWRHPLDEERAERLGTPGLTVVAVDSSEPDSNAGRIGREWYEWIRKQFDEPDDFKLFMLHHHVISIPGTGRERNVIVDAGDLLEVLTGIGLDMVVSGHKHVPFFWGLSGLLISNSSTAATRRVRGLTPPSWNEIQVDASSIKIYVHYPDGRRSLAVLRTRARHVLIREAFLVTDAFRRSNPLFLD